MSTRNVAIVGSGIVGTALAYLLTRRGHEVDVFEKGPEYPYPHAAPFRDRQIHLYSNPAYRMPDDLQQLTLSGDYTGNLNRERFLGVGGTATQWGAVTLRMTPHDFKTRSRYGYAEDWPITYADLEAPYCRAEALLGVSGTDADNPFAPRRSRPYPLPPFALSYDDRILAERLRKHNIVLHSTPQARARRPYDGRPACVNYASCIVCPIGARYSPNHHLSQAVGTGRCRLHTNTSVRRVVLDEAGRARALVYQPNDAATEKEHAADVVIVAAGGLESARLLLLSSKDRHPEGLPHGGHIGQHLMFHHVWEGRLHYKDEFLPGNLGARTGQSYQFLDPPGRGRHGGIKVELSSDESAVQADLAPLEGNPAAEVVERMKNLRHWRVVLLHGESAPSAQKYVTLSTERDRFGDPFAHVHYASSEFDRATYEFGRGIFERLASATGADDAALGRVTEYSAIGHHLGTCRMGRDMRDSVTDRFGKVHGTRNLFVLGGSNFPSSSTVHPTLTMVALAFRAGDYIIDQIL